MKKTRTGFETILIANRGEIAVRIINTARQLGYSTVAVYSEPDSQSLHVRLADRAVVIGGKTPAESYLNINKILDACSLSGADAVHPGYGFLSENAAFAQACADRGITFIGPGADAIEKMGHKSLSKDLMIAAAVPCIPGYQGKDQAIEKLQAEATKIGYPLMVKAAAGGGGRGLRLAANAQELVALLHSARTEAEKAFGSGDLLLEKALLQARHVEIQIFGDSHGNVIHLGERDCSIQRRHQKVFEESPSPAVSPQIRQAMGEAAVLAAKAIKYVGAGTVEFLLDNDGKFYFLEMNTRLQVEHPVTEMITGLDLVEWQLKVAAGQALPLTQDQVSFEGHAIEARLYAEDPRHHFRPQVGPILRWQPPAAATARTDHGLKTQDYVSPYYDSMLAKIIAYGPDRETACRLLDRALAETSVLGIRTNREFLRHCLQQDLFKAGQADTTFIKKTWDPETLADPARAQETATGIAAALLLRCCRPSSGELEAWCTSNDMHSTMKLSVDEAAPLSVNIRFLSANSWAMAIDATELATVCLREFRQDGDSGSAEVVIDGLHHKINFACAGAGELWISTAERTHNILDLTFRPPQTQDAIADGTILAPSNGLICAVEVQAGHLVQKGDPICSLESMKLIQTIVAPLSGTVKKVTVAPGQQVNAKQLLAEIEAPPSEEAVSSAPVAAVNAASPKKSTPPTLLEV